MYTGTFTFMPADKNWIDDPTQNPYQNCPAHHQFEVNLVSWRLEFSEIELTYDDTANVMFIDGHTLPCYFVIFLLNVEYIFLHFFSYNQLSHLLSNFTKQSLINTILKTILLYLVL